MHCKQFFVASITLACYLKFSKLKSYWFGGSVDWQTSILTWRIPWTEKPGGLLSMRSHRAGQDWSDLACMHALEKETATHSSILAWRIPWTEEPGGLLSVGSHRVGHDWSDLACMHSIAWLTESNLFPHILWSLGLGSSLVGLCKNFRQPRFSMCLSRRYLNFLQVGDLPGPILWYFLALPVTGLV